MAKGTHDPRYQKLIAGLAEARKGAGLSQDALAKKIGERQQFVSKYESGERRLDVVEFVVIARALKIDWPAMLEKGC